MNNQETVEIEFKREIDDKRWENWCKTVVAFSNTNGGKIMFGYDDDGNFIGINSDISDRKIRYIEQIISKHVSPIPIYKIIDYVNKNGKTAFSLYVKERKTAIAWLQIDDDQKMYVRREKMTAKATIEEMEEALLRMYSYDFDSTETGTKADIRQFTKLNYHYQKANNGISLIDKDLVSFKLATPEMFLTIAGWLFMDNSSYKNANLVCNTWPDLTKGTNKVIDTKEYCGSALDLFEKMIDYTKNVSFYSFGGIKDGLFFDDDGSFSITALREAFINAIAHRDYKINGSEIVLNCFPDRLEITSPGSNPQSSKESVAAVLEEVYSMRRNPNICNIFVKCRLMEEKGSGFAKIINDYKNMSEVFAPTYQSNRLTFTLCLKNKRYKYNVSEIIDNPITNPTEYLMQQNMFKSRALLFEEKPKLKIMESLIKQNPRISYEEIEREFGLSKEGTKYYIRLLKNACLIRRKGNNKTGSYEIVNDIDRPSMFMELDSDLQSKIINWCKTFFVKTKQFNEKRTSYGLKHILQNYDGTYLTNGQFKGAMLLSGFKVKNKEDLNWVFNVSEKSAALKLQLR